MALRAASRLFLALMLPTLLISVSCGAPNRDITTIKVAFDQGLLSRTGNLSTGLIVIDRDPNILLGEVKMGHVYSSQTDLTSGFLEAAKRISLAEGLLEGANEAALTVKSTGSVWVLTTDAVRDGDCMLFWSLPVVAVEDSMEPHELVLHRSNASLVTASDDYPQKR